MLFRVSGYKCQIWAHAHARSLACGSPSRSRYSTSAASLLAALSVEQSAYVRDADHAQRHLVLVHDVHVVHARLGQPAYVGSLSPPADGSRSPDTRDNHAMSGSLQGEHRAGGRGHTPSQDAPPVGRHQLPQGPLYLLTRPWALNAACIMLARARTFRSPFAACLGRCT